MVFRRSETGHPHPDGVLDIPSHLDILEKFIGSGSSLKEEQNVGLFGLPPQDVVAKMREIPVCVRLQADHTGIDGLEFSDADQQFDPELETSPSRLRTPTRPRSVGSPRVHG
ncbi:hypothetical protein OAL71_02690 [Phycisphaerales bacterium]|nr:hypothetical protein [Phycisphaerales bacterium]